MAAENKQQVCIVTGATSGIGTVTALEMARKGYHVFLACRNEQKTRPVIDNIKKETGNQNVDFLPLDLGSLKSVRQSAQLFLEKQLPLHVLINNAGLAGGDGFTADGFQLVFGTNHLGPFLFTVLLLPKLRESKPARIVNVASRAHLKGVAPDWNLIKNPVATGTLGQFSHYQVSKLANVAFSYELSRRLAGTGIVSNSLHPGVVATDIWRDVPRPLAWLAKKFMLSNEDGAKTSLFLATDPSTADVTGRYFDVCKAIPENPLAKDEKFIKDLWDHSVEWSGVTQDELRAAGLLN